ncbi:hypothetical protein BH23PLA1_BH23PLA1_09300 [soil metagenome]
MIGKISFSFRDRPVEAVLQDNGRWRCEAIPSLVHVLDVLYSPRWEGVPADSPAGRRHLQAAAQWLNGAAEFESDSRSWAS